MTHFEAKGSIFSELEIGLHTTFPPPPPPGYFVQDLIFGFLFRLDDDDGEES